MENINLADFSSADTKTKYTASKQAIRLSKDNPAKIYENLDFFIKLLDNENNVLVWTATKVIGNLSVVDTSGRIDRLIPKLLKLFHSKRMITSANAIISLCQIAKNKPIFANKIIDELLQVEKITYISKGEISPECRNIAIGHFLNGLKLLDKKTFQRKDVAEFITRQTQSTRPSVAKRATRMIKKL